MNSRITVRAATPGDVEAIFLLLYDYAKQEILLSRSREDIAFYLKNFVVAEVDDKVCGCAAARDFGNDLLEVRSLAVAPEMVGQGIGRRMIEEICSRLNRERREWRLFALTLRPEFFGKLGFSVVDKKLFPEKIWSDCSQCPKKDCCDEVAVLLDNRKKD